jgi:endonuclease/exonuclease/phosphatase family metal-dependent hydrolase
MPKAWRGALKNVTVESFADWSKYSDHVPLVIDVSDEPV